MTRVGRFTIAADHPSLPGHFPGRPVVPGVVLLDEALSLLGVIHPGRRAAGLARVRFLAPVGPAADVTVLAGVPDGDTLGFACHVNETEVLAGTLRLAPR